MSYPSRITLFFQELLCHTVAGVSVCASKVIRVSQHKLCYKASLESLTKQTGVFSVILQGKNNKLSNLRAKATKVMRFQHEISNWNYK